RQCPVQYVSRTLNEAERNYAPMEKLALSLIHITRRLRRYFKAHPVKVITNQPIKNILNNTKTFGKLAKYAVELGAYNITFIPRNAMKGQVLADFLSEAPEGEKEEYPMETYLTLSRFKVMVPLSNLIAALTVVRNDVPKMKGLFTFSLISKITKSTGHFVSKFYVSGVGHDVHIGPLIDEGVHVLKAPYAVGGSDGREFFQKSEHFSYSVVDLLALLENGVLKSFHSFIIPALVVVESEDIIAEFYGPSRWKELNKESGSKILPYGDGSCWKTFKPIANVITKEKLKSTQACTFHIFTVKVKFEEPPCLPKSLAWRSHFCMPPRPCIKRPNATDTEMPVKEVKLENGAENRTKNEPINRAEKEEAVKAPSSQPVEYYLKHRINKKLIKGPVDNHRKPETHERRSSGSYTSLAVRGEASLGMGEKDKTSPRKGDEVRPIEEQKLKNKRPALVKVEDVMDDEGEVINDKTQKVNGKNKDMSRLRMISCIKARKCIEKGCQLYLPQVTEKEATEEHLEDVSLIRGLSVRTENLEHALGKLTMKTIEVSDAQVKDSIAIGEIQPKVTTLEGQVEVLANQHDLLINKVVEAESHVLKIKDRVDTHPCDPVVGLRGDGDRILELSQ
nr:putative ribonuclease H-like domain-containing protein [Tanacetum cinerariifolium]